MPRRNRRMRHEVEQSGARGEIRLIQLFDITD
jgi:hypothetical protein